MVDQMGISVINKKKKKRAGLSSTRKGKKRRIN